jgi:hypothetical protein
MKKMVVLIICILITPMLFAKERQPADIQGHVFRLPNVGHTPYVGPRSTPTLVDQIPLSPVNPTGYCWGITYDWDRDCLWITQWNPSYSYMYAIQKTSPCVKIDSVLLGSGVPSYRLGIGYAGGDIVYMAGYDGNIYAVNLNTGTATFYRSTGWGADEGLGFNVVDDAVYVGDWTVNLIGYAQPAQTGALNTWYVSSPSGMSGAHSGTASPQWLFTCNEDLTQAYFFQHSLSNGVPNMTPDSTWDLPAGMTQASTADCAFDGQYIYVLDQSGPDMIWVFDVGIQLGPHVWDFETGWQGWTKTGANAFPNGWGVEWALHYASYACPAPGDSSMWFDDDAAGSSAPPLQDTALSPLLTPNASTQWLKWGVGYNYLGSPEFLEVGIKYFNGSTWSATALQTYTTDIMPGIWDSVDVSAYNTYDLVQIYFYYDDGGSWNWYGCFDNVSLNADIAQHDAGTTAILEPVGTHFLNDVVTPTATVKNHGDFDETFPVVFTITHNAALVFADTVSVTLSPGAVDTAVFASYTLAETGAYNSVCYTELVGDENPGNDTATAQANVYSGLIPYVIIDADVTPITGAWLDTKFQSWGLTGVYTTNPNVINADSLAIYQSVWICLGIYANNYALTTDQATAIGTYLATGRNVYLEGGDCWGFDASRTILCPLFGIDPNATVDGSADLFTVQGQANAQIPQVSGNNWNYTGENNWIDRLGIYASPPNGGTVAGFLWNPSVSYWTGAAYDQGTWKTVGLSHELAGDVAGTVPGDSLLMWIAQYLELQVGIQEQPVGHDVQAFGFAPRMSTIANGHVPITYTTTVSGPVSLQVYDGAGRLVQTLVNTQQPAGEKSFVWNRTDINGRKVANGVYFFRLQAENKTATHKFVLVD